MNKRITFALSAIANEIEKISKLPKEDQPPFDEDSVYNILCNLDKDTVTAALSYFVFITLGPLTDKTYEQN